MDQRLGAVALAAFSSATQYDGGIFRTGQLGVVSCGLAERDDQVGGPRRVEQPEPSLIERSRYLARIAMYRSSVDGAAEDRTAPWLRGGISNDFAHQFGAGFGVDARRKINFVAAEVVRHDDIITGLRLLQPLCNQQIGQFNPHLDRCETMIGYDYQVGAACQAPLSQRCDYPSEIGVADAEVAIKVRRTQAVLMLCDIGIVLPKHQQHRPIRLSRAGGSREDMLDENIGQMLVLFA